MTIEEKESIVREHFQISTPESLLSPAGAWALLVALQEREFIIFIHPAGFSISSVDEHPMRVRYFPTLLDAAYQLATKEQR